MNNVQEKCFYVKMNDDVNVKVNHGEMDVLEKQLLQTDKIVEVEGECYGGNMVV